MKRKPLLLALLCAAMFFVSCKKEEGTDDTNTTPETPTVGWTKITSPVTSSLLTVEFFDDQVGYAAGTEGKVLKTTDGGSTWALKNLPTSSYDVWELAVIDAQTVYACTYFAIYKTTDGGSSWNTVTTGLSAMFNKDLCFTTPTTGFLATSEGIARTTDGGATWNNIASTVMTDGWKKVEFPTVDTGYAVGNNGLIKTVDGGTTWIQMSIPMNAPNLICFINSKTGWIGSSGSGNDTILSTFLGGGTWNVMRQTSTNSISTLCFVDYNNGYAGLFSAGIKSTTNAAMNWSAVTSPAGNTTINRFCFRNASLGWAVGDNGLIMKYK